VHLVAEGVGGGYLVPLVGTLQGGNEGVVDVHTDSAAQGLHSVPHLEGRPPIALIAAEADHSFSRVHLSQE